MAILRNSHRIMAYHNLKQRYTGSSHQHHSDEDTI